MGLRPKLVSFKGESSISEASKMRSKVDVNEEYFKTFRTKSYIEICSKVQIECEQERVACVPPIRSYSRLSENILEPRTEILIELIKALHLHHLLVDYFAASLEAFRMCKSLLQIIDQLRAGHNIIQRITQISDYSDSQRRLALMELANLVKLDNLISVSKRENFGIVQHRYKLILDTLRTKHRNITRRAKVIRVCKKASAVSLVIACAGISIVTLVLALHSLVGIIATPVLVCLPMVYIKKIIKSAQRELRTSSLRSLGAQLDAAAKGVFFLNSDFNTLNQLLMWLHDEIDYRKSRAELCVRDQRRQILKEFVAELEYREPRFLERLEELEDHVYLCFLNINRFRKLVIREAIHGAHTTVTINDS